MNRGIEGKLLDALYGMDLQAPDWGPFFACLAQTFRSHVISMQVHDAMHRQGRLLQVAGVSEALLTRYESLVRDHPWFERGAVPLLSLGIADDRGLATEAELDASRFHAEFMVPARVGHGLALCLHHQGPESIAVLTINREVQAGFYDAQELQLAQALLPHLRNVYALQQRLGWLECTFQSFRSALDQQVDGILLLGADGRVLFSNIAAQRMESDRLFFLLPDGRLGVPWSADEHELRKVLQRVSEVDAAEPVIQPLHGRDGQLAGMCKLCPAAMLSGEQWSEFQVRVIVFIKAVAATSLDLVARRLESQWGFTHAEGQLAHWLMQGLSLDEAAERIGVSKNTVRSQLRALFYKTETRRQAELVRLLLQLSHVS